ncbi:anaerobic ribonucleoside-triphosphate reductase [Streptococcus sp. NLN76]|uniref:anaerobic ribonucleoside-triphosphate reductase n=1 Tax=Streptococcus sp. NLN76 TaxID=2822800 RepID=UPI0018A9F878|nr:anaerobic ribonucleoside-triphosphate reductase [Streptococcus sp. NLN76]MBF8969426.1 anaerobic ribonucleoside-triphosphate reductase [Streptococcus sp. NLN76]
MKNRGDKLQNLMVKKRDGRSVPFDFQKLTLSLERSNHDLEDALSQKGLTKVQQALEEQISQLKLDFISVGELRQLVVELLLREKQEELVAFYQAYAEKKEQGRLAALDINQAIQKLLVKDSRLVNENANKDADVFNTQRDLTAGIVGKAIGLKLLPSHVANAHQKGDIHFHDLDYNPYTPMTNCCLIDFEGMLAQGFKIGNAEVESPKSIQTATAQISQIIANVSSSQYGGCSADRIDQILAPYAELNYQKHLKEAEKWVKEGKAEAYALKKTKKDIYDAMQSLEYEINTLFTSNGQTPFTSLGFGLGTSWFEREIQKAILHIRIQGLGREGRTAIFPKLIFTLKRGLNLEPGSPNYDIKGLALECATKRMYPDILSYDKIVDLTGSFKVPMGCRSFLQGWKDEQGREVNAGRMNLGVVTVNFPRIALETRGDKEAFWKLFDERMELAKDALIYRIERVKEAKPANAPILYQYGAFGQRLRPEDSVDQVFRNRRATVSLGYIGLYEVASVFYGGNWEGNEEAKSFTLDIIRKMKSLTETWSDEYGYHFSVYSTPSESLTDRFCRLDTEKFGLIENVTDKEYYTNSFHYDVRKNPTPFEKLEFEKDYPAAGATGGFIHYCEYPVLQQNPKALEAVWDYAYDRVGYLGTNTPIDRCYACGFAGDFEPTEKGFRCPACGMTDPKMVDVVKRTCGYLGNPQARPMVRGRHKEIAARVKHMNSSSL